MTPPAIQSPMLLCQTKAPVHIVKPTIIAMTAAQAGAGADAKRKCAANPAPPTLLDDLAQELGIKKLGIKG